MEKKFCRRLFLNQEEDGGMAAVCVKLHHSPYYTEASVHITDCSRSVTLDFQVSGRGARRNALRKLALLIETLQELQDEITTLLPVLNKGKA